MEREDLYGTRACNGDRMIVIVGAGALGSHVALFLRNLDRPIKIVDFDRVEQKNCQSQVHTKMSLGKNKAQAIAQTFQGLFGVKVTPVPHKLTSGNVDALINDAELVIDCTDNIAARKVIQEFVSEQAIPCVHGGLSGDGDFARILWTEDFVPDAESGDGATCEDGEALPFFAMVAGMMSVEVKRFLDTGKKSGWQLTPSGILRLT